MHFFLDLNLKKIIFNSRYFIADIEKVLIDESDENNKEYVK